MKSLLVWFSIIITLAGCMIGGAKTPMLEKSPAEHIESSTVALVKLDAENSYYAYCAGVWLDETTILTAAHCVDKAGKPPTDSDISSVLEDPLGILVTIEPKWNPLGHSVNFMVRSDLDEDGPKQTSTGRRAVVASFDESVDLALLKTNAAPEHDSVEIATHALPSGMNVICTGHTVGLWWTYSYGRIAATRIVASPSDRRMKALQISIPIGRGNSGGGAFDENGTLIGIASFINTMAPNLAFFVHRDTVLEFIDSSKQRPLLRH